MLKNSFKSVKAKSGQAIEIQKSVKNPKPCPIWLFDDLA